MKRVTRRGKVPLRSIVGSELAYSSSNIKSDGEKNGPRLIIRTTLLKNNKDWTSGKGIRKPKSDENLM